MNTLDTKQANCKPGKGPAAHIQTKLNIGKPNDSYEQEADRVADKVVGQPTTTGPAVQKMEDEEIQTMPISKIQQQPEEEVQAKALETIQRSEDEELQAKPIPGIQRMEDEDVQAKPISTIQRQPEEELQAKPDQLVQREAKEELQMKSDNRRQTASQEVSAQIERSKGSGSTLSSPVRSQMESGIGADFGNVRIHTGSKAENLSQQLNAQAFTVGNDVYFNKGKYNPESQSGQHLLAHELTHTVQQSGGLQRQIQKQDKGTKKAEPKESDKKKTTPHETFDSIKDKSKLKSNHQLVQHAALNIKESFKEKDEAKGGQKHSCTYGNDVPEKLHPGLKNMVSFLMKEKRIKPNSTLRLHVDLSDYEGGDSLYRFTHIEEKKGGKKSSIVHIERVGDFKESQLTEDETKRAEETVTKYKITISPALERNKVLQALSRIDKGDLKHFKGLEIQVESQAKEAGYVGGGYYDTEKHTIMIKENSLEPNMTYYGADDASVSELERTFTHEFAHVIDLRELSELLNQHTALKAQEKALNDKIDALGKKPKEKKKPKTNKFNIKSEDIFGDEDVLGLKEKKDPVAILKKDLKALKEEIKSKKAELEGKVTVSGDNIKFDKERTGRDPSKNPDWHEKIGDEHKNAITQYGDLNNQEFFAESYSFYLIDPIELKALRPKTYEYFQKKYNRYPDTKTNE